MTQTSPDRHDLDDTLVERYVEAATRRLPEDQRAEVADELRTTLADRIEALADEQPDLSADAAERLAVEELGDPDRLAASYSGSSHVLIGPDLYATYVRVLRSLLISVVPILLAVLAVISAIDGDNVGAVIGTTAWTGFSVAVQIAFWVTLCFALVERGVGGDQVRQGVSSPWTPEQLPRVASGKARLGECFATVAWLGFLAGALVWQHVQSPLDDPAGARVPVLDPELWSFWLPLVLVLIAGEIAFEILKYRTGQFNPLATLAIGAVFTLPLAYLAFSERLLNPAATAEIQRGWEGFDPDVVHVVVGLTLVGIWIWDSVEAWGKRQRTA